MRPTSTPSDSTSSLAPSSTRGLRNASSRPTTTARKPCAGNPHARFERGPCPDSPQGGGKLGSTNGPWTGVTVHVHVRCSLDCRCSGSARRQCLCETADRQDRLLHMGSDEPAQQCQRVVLSGLPRVQIGRASCRARV